MSDPAIEIRVYQDADAAQVVALWREELFDPAPHNDPELALRLKLSVDRELLLVATDGGQVIGTVMGGWDGHRGWIYSVGVHATHRRRGIGSQLVLRMEQLLREQGCLKINLQVRTSNLQVIAFYESLGFKQDAVVSLGKRLY
jgi:ribosomal protein S18 acetylase RimI-like enzyme